jgi:O-antigen/teichoic acid export membrane protein
MGEAGASPGPETHGGTIARGAVVNALGLAGKALAPAFFILATRLYGPESMGVYYLAYTVTEIAISLTASGFGTGLMMLASRYAGDGGREEELYRVLANGVVVTLGLSGVLVALAYVGGPPLIVSRFTQPGILGAVQTLSWSIPFYVIPFMVSSATKAHLTMKWDAILLGFLRPALLTVSATALYFVDSSLRGLLLGHVIGHVLLTCVALVVFGRLFSYRTLFAHLLRFRLVRELFVFGVPQNLNMTFNTLITNLDVVMLGFFGFAPEKIGFYGMSAQIVRTIRQVKLAFSNSYAPVIARLHERGDREAMNLSYAMVIRWTTTIGLPVALVVAIMKADLLRVFHSTFTGDSTFMLLLIIPPLLSCSCGIAGNIVVMTGHSMWNLLNSFLVAGLNALLNFLLIPRFGFMGAAVATVIAAAIVSILQLIEADVLVGARLSPSRIYKPFLAISVPLVAVAAANLLDLNALLAGRIGLSVVAVVLFGATLAALRIDPDDVAMLGSLLRRRGPGGG